MRLQFYVVLRFHCFSQNELYVFMEYCSEGTLWTAAQQGLTDYMIRHYTREILKAVDALHDRGVVHRDIKGSSYMYAIYFECVLLASEIIVCKLLYSIYMYKGVQS